MPLPKSPFTRKAEAARNEELAVRCAWRLSPERLDGREGWIRAGMALYGLSPSAVMLGVWDAVSRRSPKWKPGECERMWESFGSYDGTRLGLGSLILWARDDSGDPDFLRGRRTARPPKFKPPESVGPSQP